MKRLLVLCALLSVVGAANADVNFYATAASEFAALSDNVFNTDEIDFLPFYQGVGGTQSPEIITDGQTTETFYVWGQFVDEAAYTQIYGINLDVNVTGDLAVGQSVMYRHNKTSGPPSARWDRWDGDQPVTLENGIVAAVTADGIMDSFMDYDLGDGQTFLVGAVEVTGTEGDILLGLGDLGLIAYDGNTGDPIRPTINILDGTPVSGPNPPDEAWYGQVATFTPIPEPASLLLIGLGALALRRR